MRLAADYDRIHAAGAELAAVSVDDEGRQAGMAERWGLTHTRMIADPGGETVLQPLDLFDPEERGGIALPGMVVITDGPDGPAVPYRFEGRDFADRTNDDQLWAALEALDMEPVDPEPWTPETTVPEGLKGYFSTDQVGPFYRGNMFAAVALGRRAADDAGRELAREHRVMAKTTLDAWQQLNDG